jgi:hypothetical protein
MSKVSNSLSLSESEERIRERSYDGEKVMSEMTSTAVNALPLWAAC